MKRSLFTELKRRNVIRAGALLFAHHVSALLLARHSSEGWNPALAFRSHDEELDSGLPLRGLRNDVEGTAMLPRAASGGVAS